MTWSFYDNAGQLKTTDAGGPIVGTLSDLTDVDTTGLVDGSLFRYEFSATEWGATTASNLLLDDNGQLQLPVTGSTGGLLIGGDTQLFRAGPNILRLGSDDRLEISGTTGAYFQKLTTAMSDTQTLISTYNTTDAATRFAIRDTGRVEWGANATAFDTTLERSAANTLAVGSDDKIQQATQPSTGNDLVNQVWAERMDLFYA